MKQETVNILREMGFNAGSNLNVRNSAFLGLDLSIKRNGTGSVIFCNGGMSEYLLLANHGATVADNDDDQSVADNIKTVCNGRVPYLTLSIYRFKQVLQSIAFNRRCLLGIDKEKGGSLAKAKRQAELWFKRIRSEENELYNAGVQIDEMEAEVFAS